MGDKSRHPGRAGLVLAQVLALCLFVAGGNALAAENAVRMPVEKGAAPDPLGELVKPRKAPEDKKPEAEAKHPGEKKAEPAPVARGEAKKPEPEAKKPEARKPEAKKTEPAKAERKPEPAKAEPKSAEKKPEPAKPGKKPEPEKAASPAPEQKAEAPKPEKKPAAEKKPEPEKKAAPAPKAAAEKKPETAKKPEAKPAARQAAKPAPKADPSANATQQLVDAPAPAALKPAPTPAPAPAAKSEAKPAPEPAPKPAPAPKPVPKPVVDPVAFVMPAGPSNPAPAIELPKEGLYVGDLAIEFQHTQIILRAATSEPVERVTTFYLKGPRRLALDLRGNWAKRGGTVVRYDTGPVKHIVVGEHPDRLRLTLEFREGAVRPDLDPAVVREPGGGVTATIPLAR